MAIKVSGTTVIDDSRNLQNSVNLNVTGNVYANTFIGDGSQLTNLPPSGGTVTATASGTLSDGSTVIVNADGTVSKAGLSAVAQAAGSYVELGTSIIERVDGTFDSVNNKVVYVYENSSTGYSEAVVGTVSGTTISFGTPVAITAQYASTGYERITFNSTSGKVVATYRADSGGYGTAVVGTVSGTSISFGTPVVFKSADTREMDIVSADGSNIVIAYKPSTGYGYGIVGAISGTSISFGSAEAIMNSNNKFDWQAVSYDSNADKVLVSYLGDSNYGYAAVGTISGTSISFGTPAQFNGTSALDLQARSVSSDFDPNTNQVAIGFVDGSDSGKCKAVMATISGTSVSFGSVATVSSNDCGDSSVQYHSAAEKVVVAFRKQTGADELQAAVGTVSGTGVSFATAFTVDDADSGSPVYKYASLAYDSNLNTMSVGYKSYGTSNQRRFRANVFQIAHDATNLTSENYLGISDGVYANNATATIQVAGAVDDAQTSLTPGQQYFVQANGSIGTTAASPSVIAGTAVAATKLLVKG
jgi:hypothetical protein